MLRHHYNMIRRIPYWHNSELTMSIKYVAPTQIHLAKQSLSQQ